MIEETVCTRFHHQVGRIPDRVAMRYRDAGRWRDITWGEYGEAVRDASCGLMSLGVQPGESVSILSRNRPEWHISDIAGMCAGAKTVPVDRKKDLIVTSQGKNVAPQEIENRLKYHPLISQAVVIGDRRPYLVALITLDAEAASRLVSERALDTFHGALADHPEIEEAVAAAVGAVNAEFSRAEQIKRWRILPRDFLQEEEEITPTLKVRRRTIADKYAGVIAELYA